MRTRKNLFVIVSAVLAVQVAPALSEPLGTAFTFQGEVTQGGVPVHGACDFEFRLYDSETSGGQIGDALTFDGLGPNPDPVSVNDGLFSVELDFGKSSLDDKALWIDVAVRCPSGSGGSLVPILPRTRLTPAPYAIQLRGVFVDEARRVGIGTTSPCSARFAPGTVLLDGASTVA